jgi:hypothetical protein
MFMANYTYSHALTNRFIGDYYTADAALENFVTLRDPGLNRGPSPYDLRHAFRTFLTYDLPFGAGKLFDGGNGVVNRIIGGWTLGSIVRVQTGRPFKLLSGYNTFNYSNAYWPDASDSGVVLNGITRSQLQNEAGVYNGPDSSEPVTVFPQSLLSSSGGAILILSARLQRRDPIGKYGLPLWTDVLERRHVGSQNSSDRGTCEPEYLGRVPECIQSSKLDRAG